jgi:hypothetical protein
MLVPGGFSYLTNKNNYNSYWKKLLGFRNMQEKLEKSDNPILVFFHVFLHFKETFSNPPKIHLVAATKLEFVWKIEMAHLSFEIHQEIDRLR